MLFLFSVTALKLPLKLQTYRRKIEWKGYGSINLYWFHCLAIFLHPSLHNQNFHKAKFIPAKQTPLSFPSFPLSKRKIALGVLLLWRLHVCLTSKPTYTNEKKMDLKPLNTRTWLLAQEDPDLQIAGMFGTKILTLSLCYPLASVLEINEVDWYRKNFLCHVLLCIVQAYVLRRLFSFKYYTKILCKIANIDIKDLILHLTIPFLCLHVSSEVNEVMTDCFVFPLLFGSFPAAVTITAVGLIWCAQAEKWLYSSKLRGCSGDKTNFQNIFINSRKS